MNKQTATLIVTAVVAAMAGVAGGVGLTARAEAEAPTAAAAQDAASGDSAWIVTSGGVEYCFLYNSRPYCRAAQPWT